MATYTYIDNQGNQRTVEAQTSDQALSLAPDRAASSGVQLQASQPAQQNVIDLGTVPNNATFYPSAVPQVQAPIAAPVTPLMSWDEIGGMENDAESLRASRDRLRNEITSIETTIGNRSADRNAQLTQAGVFDDVRRLNTLRDELTRIEDKEIEIPIQSRQDIIRGGVATTKRSFDQYTRPQLERRALDELATSRRVDSLSRVIQTNTAIIDADIAAKKEQDDVIYQQKQRQLQVIETLYTDYMTNEQKALLEARKTAEANAKSISDKEWDIIEAQAKIANDRGDFETAQRIMSSSSADQAISYNIQATNQVRGNTAVGIVDMATELLNSPGITGAVGPNPFARGVLAAGLLKSGDTGNFIAKADQLFETLTNEAIIDLRARAGAIGPISDKDRAGLANAQAAIIQRKPGEKIKMTEGAFKDAIESVINLQKKVYIASQIGNQQYQQAGWRDASQQEIDSYFNTLRSSEAQRNQQTGGFLGSDISGQTSYNTNLPRPNRNQNPGNVKIGGIGDQYALKDASGRPVVDDQNHLIFPNAQAGIAALSADIRAKLTGNSRYVPADPTLAQLGRVYAEDGNWANGVARILGVSTGTKAASIPFETLIAAITRQEGWNPNLA